MTNKDFFAVAFPMVSKSGADDALRQFISDNFDGSQEQCGMKTYSWRRSGNIPLISTSRNRIALTSIT
jgi:hypothetical protein